VRLEVDGLDRLRASLASLGDDRAVEGIVGDGLFAQGHLIGADAVKRAPVRDGILRGSMTVAGPAREAGNVTVAVGFGGQAAAYAVVQHEREDFRHPRGGEAKYLLNALRGQLPRFGPEMANYVERRVRGLL